MKLCACMCAHLLQWCPTLCDPMDCSPPGSSVHGILQAKILEWVAMPSSRDLPNPGTKHMSSALQVGSLLLSHQGSPRGALLIETEALTLHLKIRLIS